MKECIDCGKPAAKDRVRCTSCLKRASKNALRFRQKRKDANLCVDCGSHADSGIYCFDCREYRNQRARDLYAMRISKGLCKHCGRELESENKHCDKCLEMIRHARKKRYLESPHYKAKERDSFSCRICSKTKGLVIHHIDGQGERIARDRNNMRRRQKANNSLGNLITLCRGCHGALTRFIGNNPDLVIELITLARSD